MFGAMWPGLIPPELKKVEVFSVGQKWKNRGGGIGNIKSIEVGQRGMGVTHSDDPEPEYIWWHNPLDGRCYANDQNDLIELIAENEQKKGKTMSAKYPIGSQWKNRKGDVAVIVSHGHEDDSGNEMMVVTSTDEDGDYDTNYLYTENGQIDMEEKSSADLIEPFLPSAKSTAMCYVVNGVIIAGIDVQVQPDAKFILSYDAATKGMEVLPAT